MNISRVILVWMPLMYGHVAEFPLRAQEVREPSLQRVPDILFLEPWSWIKEWQESRGNLLGEKKSRTVLLLVIRRHNGLETIAVVRDKVRANANPFEEATKNRPVNLSLFYASNDSKVEKKANEVNQAKLKGTVNKVWKLVIEAGIGTQESNLRMGDNVEWYIVCREPAVKDHFTWARGEMLQALNPSSISPAAILRGEILRLGGIEDSYKDGDPSLKSKK